MFLQEAVIWVSCMKQRMQLINLKTNTLFVLFKEKEIKRKQKWLVETILRKNWGQYWITRFQTLYARERITRDEWKGKGISVEKPGYDCENVKVEIKVYPWI